MVKRLIHFVVLLAFVVPTMQSIIISTDYHRMHSTVFQQTVMHENHSCCDNKQVKEKTASNEQCCNSDCQCATNANGCSNTQPLYCSLDAVFTFISPKMMFVTKDEHYDNNIPYLLDRPPES